MGIALWDTAVRYTIFQSNEIIQVYGVFKSRSCFKLVDTLIVTKC